MNKKPSLQDLKDALDHASDFSGEPLLLGDFDLHFLGNLSLKELNNFDDISSWLELDSRDFEGLGFDEKFKELENFRGKEWANRAKNWIANGIPPIIVVKTPEVTTIGDGRGRINFANVFNLKIPTWQLTKKKITEMKNKSLYAFILEAVESGFQDVTVRQPRAAFQNASQQQVRPFDFQTLKTIQNIEQLFGYINSTSLKQSFVGEGSSRVVYKISDTQALKVAKNESGVAQNEEEIKACSVEETKNMFTKVYEVGPKSIWVIVEFAAPVDPGTFQKLSGIDFKVFGKALAAAFPQKLKNSTATPEQTSALASVSNNKFFRSIVFTIKSCSYEPGDIAKLDSWGVTQDQRLVIVDSGFTEAVNKAFWQNAAAQTKK